MKKLRQAMKLQRAKSKAVGSEEGGSSREGLVMEEEMIRELKKPGVLQNERAARATAMYCVNNA